MPNADALDAILDRLVGTPIGRNWTDGPLRIAAEVLAGKPLAMETYHAKHRTMMARLIGWPNLLCEGFQGAVGLLEEDGRRRLAVSFFSAVPPRGKPYRIKSGAPLAAMTELVRRTHPLVCDADCARCAAFLRLADEYREQGPVTQEQVRSAWGYHCNVGLHLSRRAVNANDPPERHAAEALRFALGALEGNLAPHRLRDAVRESVRVEAHVRGADGAVEVCLALARELGLAADGTIT
jgi:hypothetical protein